MRASEETAAQEKLRREEKEAAAREAARVAEEARMRELFQLQTEAVERSRKAREEETARLRAAEAARVQANVAEEARVAQEARMRELFRLQTEEVDRSLRRRATEEGQNRSRSRTPKRKPSVGQQPPTGDFYRARQQISEVPGQGPTSLLTPALAPPQNFGSSAEQLNEMIRRRPGELLNARNEIMNIPGLLQKKGTIHMPSNVDYNLEFWTLNTSGDGSCLLHSIDGTWNGRQLKKESGRSDFIESLERHSRQLKKEYGGYDFIEFLERHSLHFPSERNSVIRISNFLSPIKFDKGDNVIGQETQPMINIFDQAYPNHEWWKVKTVDDHRSLIQTYINYLQHDSYRGFHLSHADAPFYTSHRNLEGKVEFVDDRHLSNQDGRESNLQAYQNGSILVYHAGIHFERLEIVRVPKNMYR